MSNNAKLYSDKEIHFNISKVLKYKRRLGAGGTGDTHLFYDEIADKYFAIKKFVPKNNSQDLYSRFIDEVKILMNISHKNIVRIYNYYLYPQEKTGFIQMEYIDGYSIYKFIPNDKKNWNDLFIDAINAFAYLESKKILHRDIRPSNFLINMENELKVIDFGFGKNCNEKKCDKNSIVLNWPVTDLPEDITKYNTYDNKTEMYYLGWMFKKLIKNDNNFFYNKCLNKMCNSDPVKRYKTFDEIQKENNGSLFLKINFTTNQKENYMKFAEPLSDSLLKFKGEILFEKNINNILESLYKVMINNSLEEVVQGNNKLLSCFIKSVYVYRSNNLIPMSALNNFYCMLINVDSDIRAIIIDNIVNRLSNKPQIANEDDDLPF